MTWVLIALATVVFWTGVGFGIYFLTTDPAPHVVCSKPVVVRVDQGAISAIRCDRTR